MTTVIYGQRTFQDNINLSLQKGVKFFDSTTAHSTQLRGASSITADFTLTLPATDSTGTQALTSNGSGVLSWASYLSATLATGSIFVGVGGVATATDTASQGEITASASGLMINEGVIVNADINASAAIAYSKLNLTGSIVNADVNASAAIAYSKLSLTGSIVNADINASAAIAYSKLNLTGDIVNADIAAAAAIAYSKLAALTASRALQSDGSGFVSASSVTSTELGYVSGVTSAIQTQLNARATFAATTWATADGTTKAFTHSLGTKDIQVTVRDMADDSLIEVDSIVATSTSVVTLTASEAPNASSWRVVVVGA